MVPPEKVLPGVVEAVARSASHSFSKSPQLYIRLVANHGVEGDAHAGITVKHRSRVARDPNQPNLRQVHLLHAELHEELRAGGFDVAAGDLGENITTRGIDILALPRGARLHVGHEAIIEVTGLRNPCVQIDRFRRGLLNGVLGTDEQGKPVRKSGVMGVVVRGGDVHVGDPIVVSLPTTPHLALEVV